MNISGEDIVYLIILIICIIGVITSFKWLECVYKYCFNDKYIQTVRKDIDVKVMHEFMCIFAVAPFLVGISSIIIIVSIFTGII